MRTIFALWLVVAVLFGCSWGILAANTDATQGTNPNKKASTEQYTEAEYQEVQAAVNGVAEGTLPDLQANAIMLVEPVTGDIIYEKNADAKVYPASTTKVMTLILALEAINDGKFSMEDEVTASAYAASIEGSSALLAEGEVHTLHDLLAAMAVGSANDAAMAVAEYLGGSEEGFVKMMNDKAAALGMTGTHYMNPHGLHDDNHYTTARDMMTLSLYAIEVPQLLDFTSMKEFEFRPDPHKMLLYNTNKLLFWYEGTQGLKTGTTSPAGRCLLSTVVRDDLRLVGVVMGGTVKNSHYSESMKLMNYGFSQYTMAEIIAPNQSLTAVGIAKGKDETVNLMITEAVRLPSSKTAAPNYTVEYEVNSDLVAPLEQGSKAGEVIVSLNGKELARADLVTVDAVEKQTFWQAIVRFFKNLF
ncbi:MAG: D-alanyl-D-alanine carboxypeptidase family protein [Bacillota bacterium]|nr:D-alanyl-D-alanine carboxypeptidase family protein [Bacillota bacterium]